MTTTTSRLTDTPDPLVDQRIDLDAPAGQPQEPGGADRQDPRRQGEQQGQLVQDSEVHRPRRGWTDPPAAHRTVAQHRTLMLTAGLILALVSVGDLVLIKSTLDRVLRQPEALSWVFSVSLATGSAALMVRSGHQARHRQAEGGHLLSMLMPALIWVLLGAGLCYLRWNAVELAPAAAAFEGSQTAEGEDERLVAAEHTVAVVLLVVFAVTGTLAMLDGFQLTNPVAAAERTARRLLLTLDLQIAESQARLARLVDHAAIALHDVETVPGDAQQALAAHRALADELKELARVQIAGRLQDPAATGVVLDRPRHRLEPQDGS